MDWCQGYTSFHCGYTVGWCRTWCRSNCRRTVRTQWTGCLRCLSASVPVSWSNTSRRLSRLRSSRASCLRNSSTFPFIIVLINQSAQRKMQFPARDNSKTGSSATAEIARDAWNNHSRSLKVIRYCANRRGIYDFLLALINSNLTSIFNRTMVIEIWHLACTCPYPSSLQGRTGERRLRIDGHALVSGCPEHWSIQP